MNLSVKRVNWILLSTFLFLLILPLGAYAAGGGKGWQVTDTWRITNFAVLAIGLFFILRKPVSQALNGRIKGIEDQLNDLEVKKKEAEDTLAEYNKKIATLDSEAAAILDQYKEQGEAAKKRILEEAAKSAEKLEEQAKKNIDHEFKAARIALQEEITNKALEKAEEIVKHSVSSDDQSKLMDEYLTMVEA